MHADQAPLPGELRAVVPDDVLRGLLTQGRVDGVPNTLVDIVFDLAHPFRRQEPIGDLPDRERLCRLAGL